MLRHKLDGAKDSQRVACFRCLKSQRDVWALALLHGMPSSISARSLRFPSTTLLSLRARRPYLQVLEYPELGMEAVWKIEVEDFPAFVVVDDKGNDFFKKWSH